MIDQEWPGVGDVVTYYDEDNEPMWALVIDRPDRTSIAVDLVYPEPSHEKVILWQPRNVPWCGTHCLPDGTIRGNCWMPAYLSDKDKPLDVYLLSRQKASMEYLETAKVVK